MEETKPQSSPSLSALQRLQPSIESATKVLFGGSAILYAVGLLIANLYFQQYGLSDLPLFKPQYVVVGLLWCVLLIFAWLITEHLWGIVEVSMSLWRKNVRLQRTDMIANLLSSVFWFSACIIIAGTAIGVMGVSR